MEKQVRGVRYRVNDPTNVGFFDLGGRFNRIMLGIMKTTGGKRPTMKQFRTFLKEQTQDCTLYVFFYGILAILTFINLDYLNGLFFPIGYALLLFLVYLVATAAMDIIAIEYFKRRLAV